MKTMLLAIALLVSISAISQEKYLSISDSKTGKEKVFNQNKRVRIKTIQGGKIKGKLSIIDENQIMISNIIVPITNIEKIKHNPLILNALVSGTLVIIGVYGIVGGLVFLTWSGEIAGGIILSTVGVGSIIGGVLSPNFLPSAKVTGNNSINIKTRME